MNLRKGFTWLALLSVPCLLQGAGGCGGAEFAGDTAPAGKADAGAPQAGASSPGDGGDSAQAGMSSGGAPGSGGSVIGGCHGPEDCSDGDPCTTDTCREDGRCFLSPKCAATEKCCAGDCGECCDDKDCDDGVGCTDDQCFAGTCQHAPNPASCGAAHYCSLKDDCVAQEACNSAAANACDDGNPCTSDSCKSKLCVHGFCDAGSRCCPDSGCAAECCSNAECDTDGDPCTVGVCTAGKCSQTTRCGDGEKCCVGADGSATCGACCAAADCGDTVGCTVDACIEGRCFHAAGSCDSGYSCDPAGGCKKDVECKADADCSSHGCGRCDNGTCAYGCGAHQVCCNNSCQGCCSAADCSDGIDCTDNVCDGGTCKNPPNNKLCPLLQTCNVARRGCVLL